MSDHGNFTYYKIGRELEAKSWDAIDILIADVKDKSKQVEARVWKIMVMRFIAGEDVDCKEVNSLIKNGDAAVIYISYECRDKSSVTKEEYSFKLARLYNYHKDRTSYRSKVILGKIEDLESFKE